MKRRGRVVLALLALAALAVALMMRLTLRRTTRVVLPDTEGTTGTEAVDPSGGGSALALVEVTPETVRAVVATLERPESYCRTVTVTQFWSGGSASYNARVTVHRPWTRVDLETVDGRVRHSLTDGTDTYIWYDSETAFYQAPAGSISADNEQHIPTYEDVLELPAESIVLADHRDLSGVDCVYLETAEDAGGYAERWWVSLETGLLASAERLYQGKTVYRMEGLALDPRTPSAGDFTLPDGAVLAELP